MTKTMTLSLLTASLLIGLGGSAFAATARHAEERASRIYTSDPADPPPQARADCSIGGQYLGEPYCFGGEGYGGETIRSERRAERIEQRGAY